jgi:hypothetical protein
VHIIGVSGSGIGAGKSSFCRKFADETWSLAGQLRAELKRMFPAYDWFNKEQAYKESRFREGEVLVLKAGVSLSEDSRIDIRTVRDALIFYGQVRCEQDEQYWVKCLAERLDPRLNIADGVTRIGIDDIRKVCEVEYLREKYGKQFQHFHIVTPQAEKEIHFDNDKLAEMCDYQIRWSK